MGIEALPAVGGMKGVLMMTSTARGSIEIDVPVETVFALVSDLERFKRAVPAIDRVAIRDVATSDDGRLGTTNPKLLVNRPRTRSSRRWVGG